MLTSRGRGGIDRLFMGSVAERVVAESNRAVLMVPVHEEMGVDIPQEDEKEPVP